MLEAIELVACNPRRASNISEATLFRVIEKFKPTLLLDEAETLKGKSERAEFLRQILNAGNRQGAVATRCVGQGATLDVKDFSVFCPKVVCGIGNFPPTIADRAICIPMQRRNTKKDRLDRFSQRFTSAAASQGTSLQSKASTFAAQMRAAIEAAYSRTTLDFLGDRDADSWSPLFAILAVADPARLPELRGCAETLTGAKAHDTTDEILALRLLSDLQNVWLESEPYAFSEVLTARLRNIDDAPWGESETNLTKRKLAQMLKGFKLRPSTVRIEDDTKKGYSREEFVAASAPYLADDRALRQCGYSRASARNPKLVLAHCWGLRQAIVEAQKASSLYFRVSPARKRRKDRRSVARFAVTHCNGNFDETVSNQGVREYRAIEKKAAQIAMGKAFLPIRCSRCGGPLEGRDRWCPICQRAES